MRVRPVITMCPMSLTAVVPVTMSAREVIGNSSHSSATIPWAMSKAPVIRRARRPAAARRTPIPNAIHSTVQIGEKAVRKALAGEPVADSSLTACDSGS